MDTRRAILFVGLRLLAVAAMSWGWGFDFSGASFAGESPLSTRILAIVVGFVAFVSLTLWREFEWFLQSRPNVQFDGHLPASAIVTGRDATHGWAIGQGYFVRLAFKNNARNPSGIHSTAQDMTAHITIFDENHNQIDDWEGRWATLDEPKNYGEIWQANRYNLQANNQQAILDIGFRLQGFSIFQGWDNYHYLCVGQSRQELKSGCYVVKVRLAPSNCQHKDFWFKLVIPTEIQSDDLNQVKIVPIKKPNLGKAGSQP